MGEQGVAMVEQQPRPIAIEQSPKENEGFSSRLAEIRRSARTIVPRVTLFLINTRLEKLNREKGLLKILTIGERQWLARQRASIQTSLDNQTETKSKVEFPNEEQRDLFVTKIGQEIKTIANKYENLLGEILQDGTMAAEIKEGYARTVIAPSVDKGFHNEDERNAFYSALSNYINHREDSESQREAYRKSLHDSLPWWLDDDRKLQLIQPLQDFEDKKIIKSMVARLAAKDIAAIKGVPPEVFENALKPTDTETSEEASFKALLLQKINDQVANHPLSFVHSDVIFFQAVKSSGKANEIFGEEIKKQDQDYYTEALNETLNKSLSLLQVTEQAYNYGSLRASQQGDCLKLLYYYPTPDAIRNLVAIAATRNYSMSVNASHVLRNLTSRADWQDILAKAEEAYPFLKTVGPLLSEKESFDSSDGYRHKIVEASQDLILSIVENSASDPRLKELSTQALTAHSILGILTKKGVIRASEVTMLDKILEQPGGDYFISYDLKGNLFKLLQTGKTTDEVKQQLEIIRRFETLSRLILENKSNLQVVAYLKDDKVIKKLQDPSLKQEDINVFLEASKTVPALFGSKDPAKLEYYQPNYELLYELIKQFKGNETVQLFNDLSASYSSFPDQLANIAQLVGESGISRERALELPTKAGDIFQAGFFPIPFLDTDENIEFFKKMLVSYNSHKQNISEVTHLVLGNRISRAMALELPEQAPGLMQDKMKETRAFIWNHGETMLKDTSDLKFLNRLVGEFGQKADPLIRGYQECLAAGVITTNEKELVLEFARQFRVISPITLAGYKEAKQGGQEKTYIVQLKALAERMTGSGTITQHDRKKPYYKDLLRHVYANNSGQWSSFEKNDSCSDRTLDLTEFAIKPRYEIDLFSNSEIRIKAGETLNHSVQDEVQRPILAIAERMNVLGHDKEKIMSALQENIDKTLAEIVQKGGLQGIDLKALTSTEEKMFLVLTDSIYGTRSIDPKRVKDLVITYEFAAFEDISDYITGTSDRVGRASNQDYALLCEVGAFYSDRIKEINRRLVTAAYNNPQIADLMPEYFSQLAQDSATTQRQDRINRLQIDRLGMSKSFVKQLTSVLEKRKGRKYPPSEVREIIRRYESSTDGLQEKISTSKNPQTRSFYGQLRSQRERTFEALQVIAGEKVDSKTVHLGEISLQQALETETGIKEGKYNGEQFASYTVQRFIDLFDNERTKIEEELAKFESMSGTQREVLHGYITKSKETANARMVGGVCVAGDNPSKNKSQNMWDMPNYLQLVFQEPDTLQCQGLVLLHHFTQDGKRILTASINPSSTYLYSVDEVALLNGIMGTLQQFAQDNNFDMITVSQNRTIRTNRTGGQFEKSMDARITSVGKKFKFNSPQTFSYNPNYQLQEMDVVWEKT